MYINIAEHEVYGRSCDARTKGLPLPVGYVLYRVEVLLSGSYVAVRNEAGSSTFTGNTGQVDIHVLQHAPLFSNSVTTRSVSYPPLLAQPHDNASRASDLTLPNWSA
jgi:hypothetical protein